MHDVPFDPLKIDLVSLSPDGSTVRLHIVNDQGWSGSNEQLESLQEKIQTYVSFAVDGQLTTSYPETTGLPWQIVVECQAGAPDARTNFVLGQITNDVRKIGGDMSVNA